MKYSHPQAVYQWIHVDFSVKQVWCEWKWMGFAAVVHTEVLVKKQLGHWDQENTLPIFARVRAIALPSPPREIGTKNWMNVYIDNSSWYFFPSTFQIAIFLLPRIYCSLCCAPETQYLSLGQFTVLSLFPFMHPHPQGLFWNNYFFCVGGYIKIRLLQMGRWNAGCAHRLHPNQSVVTHARDLLHFHLWGAYGVLWIFEHSSGLIFMPAGAWGAVGLVSISIAALLSLWQGAAWGSSCCWGAWVGWDRAGAHEISLLRAPGQQPPLITRPGGHETIPDIYSHPSALCRKTQNCMKNLVKPCIWLHH